MRTEHNDEIQNTNAKRDLYYFWYRKSQQHSVCVIKVYVYLCVCVFDIWSYFPLVNSLCNPNFSWTHFPFSAHSWHMVENSIPYPEKPSCICLWLCTLASADVTLCFLFNRLFLFPKRFLHLISTMPLDLGSRQVCVYMYVYVFVCVRVWSQEEKSYSSLRKQRERT